MSTFDCSPEQVNLKVRQVSTKMKNTEIKTFPELDVNMEKGLPTTYVHSIVLKQTTTSTYLNIKEKPCQILLLGDRSHSILQSGQ